VHTVIETPTFVADCRNGDLSDDEVGEIVRAIALDPLAGDLIPGTGGARKRRFAGRGKGKSGGYRTVSYFGGNDVPVLLLALVDKGERANITRAEASAIKKELAAYADDYRGSVQGRAAALRGKGRT
jgi:hypothetical protein